MVITKISSVFSLTAAILVLLLGCLFFHLQHQIYQPYRGYESNQNTLLIPRGLTVSRVADLLEENGIVPSSDSFLWYVRIWHRSFSPKAGEYRFDSQLNLIEVARKLHAGEIHYHSVTIPEGLTMSETVERLVALGFGDRESFLETIHDPAPILDLDPDAANLEGYLFPETYLLTRETTEEKIIHSMTDGLRSLWTDGRKQQALGIGFTLREVLTMASLIEKETGTPAERRLVSAVFHNRLKMGMKLACDPTIIYGVKLIKEYDGVINQSDLNLDSPYNTYKYPGLPPGPIANPGLASIDAALNPADVDYLFFVSRNDGTHIFSNRYRDHQRAVEEYQR